MNQEIDLKRHRKYEEDTNKMLEILHKNHRVAQARDKIENLLNDGDEIIKKEQGRLQRRKDFVAIIVFILLMTFVLAVFIYQFNKLCEKREEEFLKNCTRTNNQEYCEEILYD